MICRVCGEEFTPQKKHTGYINVCQDPECKQAAREPVVKPKTLTASVMVAFDDEVEI